MTWEIFKRDFLAGFFPIELMESKVKKFINFCQGGINVLYYSLRFTKLSNYASFLVANIRDDMSLFLQGCLMT